jgi:hypothetical protein
MTACPDKHHVDIACLILACPIVSGRYALDPALLPFEDEGHIVQQSCTPLPAHRSLHTISRHSKVTETTYDASGKDGEA